ncbi:MAG: hypothetical protein WAM82_08790 [Thermoanaerobaculia bacterium]
MPATATIEAATIAPLASDVSPSVTYDSVNQVISATVIISKVPGQPEPNIVAAPIHMPAGPWTMQWNLIAGSGIASVTFPLTDGVVVPQDQIPPIPLNVTVGESQRNSDTQWQVEFVNAVRTVNSFKYDIAVIPVDSANRFLGQVIVHDPTIAVTQDPIT